MTETSPVVRRRWAEMVLVVAGLLIAAVVGVQESMSDCFMCTSRELAGLLGGWIVALAGVCWWQYHRDGPPLLRLLAGLVSWAGVAVASVAVRLAIVAAAQGGV